MQYVLGVSGLDGPLGIGAGVSLLGLLGILFTLLVNALLKTASRSDALNSQMVKDKDARITQLEALLKESNAERDVWFNKYDEIRAQYADEARRPPNQ